MEIYNIGTKRVCRRFVFLKTVNRETRYLQVVFWEEEYVHVFLASFDDYCEWRPTRWLSEKEVGNINFNPNKVIELCK